MHCAQGLRNETIVPRSCDTLYRASAPIFSTKSLEHDHITCWLRSRKWLEASQLTHGNYTMKLYLLPTTTPFNNPNLYTLACYSPSNRSDLCYFCSLALSRSLRQSVSLR